MHLEAVKKADPETYRLINLEKKRQMEGIELIPSENLVSQAVLEAMGSVGTNKYSEGYPGRRYYGGNEVIDRIEGLAIERLKRLFKAEHANVQPLSGSPANMAVYMAFMEVGDTFMGMKLSEGGHLTHGSPVNFSGMLFNCVSYGVDRKTEMLDYDEVLKKAREVGPKVIVSGYTAYPRAIDFKAFREICDEVGAKAVADIAHIAGLIAGGFHQNPTPFFDAVTTTTHKTLRGPRGAAIMCKAEFGERIDKMVFPGIQGGPHEHIIAAKAVCFKEAMQPSFSRYARRIIANAKALADELLAQNLRLVSGGTDTHLILIDVSRLGLTGKEAETALESAGIYCNKNTIPFDKRSPFNPSGIRIGTPTITTRGMREGEMKVIGEIMARVLSKPSDTRLIERARQEVRELCAGFPFYNGDEKA